MHLGRGSCPLVTTSRVVKNLILERWESSRKEIPSSRAQLFLAALKACGVTRDLDAGRFLHSRVIDSVEKLDFYVGSSIINMYAKCGSLENARSVFQRMPVHDIVSWNALMMALAENGQEELAMKLFAAAHEEANARTFVAALKACTTLAAKEEWKKLEDGRLVKVESLQIGTGIHHRAERNGWCSDSYLMNSLVDMYAKCGSMVEARRVFEAMVDKDVVSWNALLLGYVDNGEGEMALQLFLASRMECSPNYLTFVAALKACAAMAAKEGGRMLGNGRVAIKVESLEKGMRVHSLAVKNKCDKNMLVTSGLIAMYAKCGSMRDARTVFDRMPCHDLVLWNVLVLGYGENSEEEMVLDLVSSMTLKGCSITYVAAIKACTGLSSREEGKMVAGKLVKSKSLDAGRAIHSRAANSGYDSVLFLSTSLVNLYAKCGSMPDARKVFDAMPQRTVAVHNAMMLGYVENREEDQALELFFRMKSKDGDGEGLEPDSLSFIAALKACGGMMAAGAARKIHAEVCRVGMESSAVMSNSLVDTYGRCGRMSEAHELFTALATAMDSVTWTSLIAGYSRLGDSDLVFHLFDQMLLEGLQADKLTFNSVLSACAHAGLVDRGRMVFQAMSSPKFGIKPDVEHYTCLIDMLGRANELELAAEVLDSMPVKADAFAWTTLLGACNKWNNVAVGQLAYDELLRIDEKEGATYVLMSSIYGHKCSQQ
ncbi:pentatricopeptide repeat-containing protein At4g39530-like [Selaginella moellendorffii]|uniref:pentatricopeptide repeat-containing protein At4g39530-like n=1 Tax=Selaginella moellendorffii TaxID=88036 RepID=UPI000D1C9440|nr:pentatricopeptide repeat-containing protein At4g39530-like [Selaginella moellendorffii]|eukprot:XP_024533645.1 pentatricopeptide repeat-containing protein At4g39530-like [Selaginella moellendorffii]